MKYLDELDAHFAFGPFQLSLISRAHFTVDQLIIDSIDYLCIGAVDSVCVTNMKILNRSVTSVVMCFCGSHVFSEFRADNYTWVNLLLPNDHPK